MAYEEVDERFWTASTLADNMIRNMSDKDLRQYAYCRLVDELMEEPAYLLQTRLEKLAREELEDES